MPVDARWEVDARVPVSVDADILTARLRGRALAARLGFSSSEQAVVATAISEVARNILEYARRGEITLATILADRRRGLLIIAEDRGPGIADVAQAMQDGYSTSGGLGLGLPGTRRLMDEFSVISVPARGTTVRMVKWTAAPWRPLE